MSSSNQYSSDFVQTINLQLRASKNNAKNNHILLNRDEMIVLRSPILIKIIDIVWLFRDYLI